MAIQYDKFEQRAFVKNGNGTKATYSYRPDNRRLLELVAGWHSGGEFQDLNYTYG